MGIGITHAHFVYFYPSVRVKFVFLARPTSLSHRNTHALSVEHAHPFNSAHQQPLMSQSIIMSLTHMPKVNSSFGTIWIHTMGFQQSTFCFEISLSLTHTHARTCARVDIVSRFIFLVHACTPFVYLRDVLSMPRTHAIYLSLNIDMCHTNSFSLLARCPCALHGTSRCICLSSLSCERKGWTR